LKKPIGELWTIDHQEAVNYADIFRSLRQLAWDWRALREDHLLVASCTLWKQVGGHVE
jgi:hypothetical protein